MYGAPAQISWIWIVSSLTGIKLTSAPIGGYARGHLPALITGRHTVPGSASHGSPTRRGSGKAGLESCRIQITRFGVR